jgi:hypothetical protein
LLVDVQVRNRLGHVEPNLQHELRLALEPRRDLHLLAARVEVNQDRRLLEQSQGNVFLRRQARHGHLSGALITS